MLFDKWPPRLPWKMGEARRLSRPVERWEVQRRQLQLELGHIFQPTRPGAILIRISVSSPQHRRRAC
jgi:hypothetical protein